RVSPQRVERLRERPALERQTNLRTIGRERTERARNHEDEHYLSEGLRPSDSPARALARRFASALRSRGSLAALVRIARSYAWAVLTAITGGSPSTSSDQSSPSFTDPNTFPLRVPKYTPAGDSVSTAMPSRRTVSYAPSCGRPDVSASQCAPASCVR